MAEFRDVQQKTLYLENYICGLRNKIARLSVPITITDIQSGFVDTTIVQGEGLSWVASPEQAVKQIYQTIRGKNQTTGKPSSHLANERIT